MPPRLLQLPTIADERGALSVADGGESIPFSVARFFTIRDVPPGRARAGHAQLEGEELLNCVAGACTVDLRWDGGEETHRLDRPDLALYLPPRVWVECRDFSADAVLLVLCSKAYDPADQTPERP